MPLLVNKLIFTLVPKRTPFLLRPLANILFGALLSNMVEPRIKTHLDFVSVLSISDQKNTEDCHS